MNKEDKYFIIFESITIIIYFITTKYCECCNGNCGIYTQNIFDIINIISVLMMFGILFAWLSTGFITTK